MKTFIQYVAESADTPVVLHINQFPLLSTLAASSDTRGGRYNAPKHLARFLEIINPALKAGTITNPVYQDAKSHLSTINDAIKEVVGEAHYHGGKVYSLPEKIRDLDLTYGDPHHVAGKVKKLQKIDTQHPVKDQYLQFANEFTVLFDALASMKDKVVKRQPKADDETTKPTYIPPSASFGAMGAVLKVLTKITDETKVKFAADLEQQYISQVQQRFDNPPTRADLLSGKRRDAFTLFVDSMLMTRVGEDYDNFTGAYRKLKSNWKSTLKQMADREADGVQQLYLAKNVRKLAKIVELKGNLKGEPEVLKAYVMASGFGGEVRVSFEDGAQFTVRNKSVWKVNEHGTQFIQFPTTFHDVTLEGGKRMAGQPSEKEMIEKFAGGKASDVPKED
jgi:hypothetical protein